jgi:BirA family biotin operon repressor/biotin-[acetyl-CoA-carboxylase] ligase
MSPLFARPIVFPVIDSTNRYVAEQARDGAPEGLVAVADLQTEGRGRQGRTWVADAGSSLLCSMLFRPNLGVEDFHFLLTIVGLAAHRVVEELTGVTCEMKWPNDLLIDGKKVSGLLGEVVALAKGYALVVGIGINLCWEEGFPPSEGDEELVTLAERATTLAIVSGERFDRDDVLTRMLSSIEIDYSRLTDPAVRMEIMNRYRSACGTIGKNVRVEMAEESFEGMAIGVSERGALIVQTLGEIRELDAADVIHLRTTTMPTSSAP